MAANGDRGHGTTASFSSTGLTGNFRSFGEHEQTIEDIPDDHLESDKATTVPGDLEDPGEMEFELYFDTSASYPSLGTVETLTITYPTPNGLSNGATHAGTGYIKRIARSEIVSNQLMMIAGTWKWDGKTGPAFTAAT